MPGFFDGDKIMGLSKDPVKRQRQLDALIHINDRPIEEQRAMRLKAANTANERIAKRKSLAVELKALLSQDDIQEKMCIALIKAVQEDRNASAFVAIRDTIGEKPADVSINVNTDDEQARLTALEEARQKLGIGGAYDGEGETESASGPGESGEAVVSGEDTDTL